MAQPRLPPDWPTCKVDDCIGIKVKGQDQCLAHVTLKVRDAFIAALKPEDDLDVRGTPPSPELLRTICAAFDVNGGPRFGSALFMEAQFSADAGFVGAQFAGDAEFRGAQFSGAAWFQKAQFSADAGFDEAQFSADAGFVDAQFSGAAEFRGAQFSGAAWFQRAQFSGDAGFDGAQFSGDAQFWEAEFSGDARFESAQFATAGECRPIIVAGELNLDKATFGVAVVIEASAFRLSCVDATFKDASTLRLRFAQVALDGTALGKPSTISFAREVFWSGADGIEEAKGMNASTLQPRILSLRRTDLVNLVVADCDLSSCLFEGAHNLDKLRLEGPPPFAYTPTFWRQLTVWRIRLPIGRLARRQALAEEHQWRSVNSRATDPDAEGRPPHVQLPAWYPPQCRPPAWLIESAGRADVLSPDRLAVLYRGLRKAFEDSKNAPGAADFYYGEMEMRRLSRTSSWSDRLVLWTYWLVSGYGLRASRALAAFAATVMLFSGPFWAWGLVGHPTYWIALLRAFESATSLLRPAPAGLSPVGELLDAILRLLGTTLLGLALFSLRGRIKR